MAIFAIPDEPTILVLSDIQWNKGCALTIILNAFFQPIRNSEAPRASLLIPDQKYAGRRMKYRSPL